MRRGWGLRASSGASQTGVMFTPAWPTHEHTTRSVAPQWAPLGTPHVMSLDYRRPDDRSPIAHAVLDMFCVPKRGRCATAGARPPATPKAGAKETEMQGSSEGSTR